MYYLRKLGGGGTSSDALNVLPNKGKHKQTLKKGVIVLCNVTIRE